MINISYMANVFNIWATGAMGQVVGFNVFFTKRFFVGHLPILPEDGFLGYNNQLCEGRF